MLITSSRDLDPEEVSDVAAELLNQYFFKDSDGPFAVHVDGRPSKDQLSEISGRLCEQQFNGDLEATRVAEGGYVISTHSDRPGSIDDLI